MTPILCQRGRRQAGQATVLVLGALVLAATLGSAVAAAIRVAVARAHAQRVADEAALAGAVLLARHPLAGQRAGERARERARRSGLTARVTLGPDSVAVRVAMPPLRLPASPAGGVVVTAAATAAPAVAVSSATLPAGSIEDGLARVAERYGLDLPLLAALRAADRHLALAVAARRLARGLDRADGDVPRALASLLGSQAAARRVLAVAGATRPTDAVLLR